MRPGRAQLFLIAMAAALTVTFLSTGTMTRTSCQDRFITTDTHVRPNATAIAALTLEEARATFPASQLSPDLDQLPQQVGAGFDGQIITDLRYLNESQVPAPQLPLMVDTDQRTVVRPYQPTRFIPPPLPSREQYTTATVRDRLPPTSPGTVRVQPAAGDILVDGDMLTELRQRQQEDPVVIRVQDGVQTLEQVHAALRDTELLTRHGDRFTARAPILVGANASLIIRNRTVDLMTPAGAFLASSGQLFILRSTVRSWDGDSTSSGLVSKRKLDATDFFRPFIWGADGSQTYIAGSTISHLGFRDAESYGITFTGDEGPPAGGWIVDSTIRSNHYGFYSDHAQGVVMVDNRFTNNIQYGIDPHDFTTDLLIADNRVTDTRLETGIAASRGIAHGHIINNTAINNSNGIMLDRYTHDMVLAHNRLVRNRQRGIALYESQAILVYNNTMQDNADHSLIARNSWTVGIFNNTVKGTSMAATARSMWDGTRDLARDPYRPFVSLTLGGNSFTVKDGPAIETVGPTVLELHQDSTGWPEVEARYHHLPGFRSDSPVDGLRIIPAPGRHVRAETEQIAWTTLRRAVDDRLGFGSDRATRVIDRVLETVMDRFRQCH